MENKMAEDIGQDNPIISQLEQNLETDGAAALKAYVIAEVPLLGVPGINLITGLVIDSVSKFIVKNLDNLGYAIYVSAKLNTQVSKYIAAQESGNQGAIDSSGDGLIHLGNI